ncbi:MAG: hypothetical protein A2571_03615 [Candidatus Vogelbacteria bacterium RIFOXYD1_FULL_44_32]|uniref:DUF2065 domain-containing protein n=1 Tax=Candidatus Vogelbacteria bacterium RIFOXYD1_FULL_44_32 TaxID=1802438 RepID=A0A1G2QC16_9BACT|nr:MAG: hypothetical protein A2571_03615 [Candidatus Vogelbacteria bacterium RIFOXYD1_FULL_44_32]
MELSIFLSQALGIYLVLIGLICITRRKMMMAAVADMINNRALIYLVGILELLAGIGLVLVHNIWAWNATVIITITGWAMLIEAIAYLVLPYRVVAKIFRRFNTKNWYVGGGLVAVLLGAYLAAVGFGLM